jgi:ferredoxin
MVMHLKENQVPRENVVIIGAPCTGMIDNHKLEKAAGERNILGAEPDGSNLNVTLDTGETLVVKTADILLGDCRTCRYPTPVLYDILAGEPIGASGSDLFADIREIEGKSPDERWALFVEEMKKCTRCYACRNACPLCYCEECFAEQTRPRWIGITDDLSDVMFYQMGRMFHMAGRCIDCGACEAACPNGVRLRLFTKKIVKDSLELFNYTAGLSIEEDTPLATFKPDDPNEFVM